MRRSRDRVVDKKRRSGNKNKARPREHFAPDSRPDPSTRSASPSAKPLSGELKKLLQGIGTPRPREFQPDPFQLEALAALEFEDVLVTAPTALAY